MNFTWNATDRQTLIMCVDQFMLQINSVNGIAPIIVPDYLLYS